jgi:hypothetical protein
VTETELPQTTTEALESERQLGLWAREIREAADLEDDPRLTPRLLNELWPLLSEPIPPAFIQTVPAVEGKPYPSTGIRSVQVQFDRLNNVLTPLWWWYDDKYELEGKLCCVGVHIGNRGGMGHPFASAHSYGGVSRGSSIGNVYKGSFTNAAKLAIARLGPGHEVYVGATDLDPDVSVVAAEAAKPESGGAPGMIGKQSAKQLVDHAWLAGESKRLRLAASKLAGRELGDCSTKTKAVTALTGALTFEQAEQLDGWLNAQAEKNG